MSTALLVIANGGVSFLASLAAFVLWHHLDLEGRYERRGVRKARESAIKAGEPPLSSDRRPMI